MTHSRGASPRARPAAARADSWRLGSSDPLSPEELAGLVDRYKREHDIDARNRVVESHLRLLAKSARRHSGPHAPFDDLMPEGALALIRALDSFDPARGVTFTSYAAAVIDHAVRGAAAEASAIVRTPARERRRLSVRRRAELDFFLRCGRAPAPSELSQPAAPAAAPWAVVRPSSFSLSADSGDATAPRTVVADGGPIPLERVEAMDQADALREAFRRLPSRCAEALHLRLGLGSSGRLTPAQIAARMGSDPRTVERWVGEGLRLLRSAADRGGPSASTPRHSV